MKIEAPVHFNGFRLDPHEARLCHGEEPIPLTPKAFALLSYLAGRPGQLLTKHQLLNAVWEDTLVSDAALTVCIREVRRCFRIRRGSRASLRRCIAAATGSSPRSAPPIRINRRRPTPRTAMRVPLKRRSARWVWPQLSH